MPSTPSGIGTSRWSHPGDGAAFGQRGPLEIGVLDNGPGIPADRVEHLFKPLTTSKKEGLGLGLSICLAIVEAHGGRIWLHSRQSGATEFRLSLPLEPPEHT